MGLSIESLTKLVYCGQCKTLMTVNSVADHFHHKHTGTGITVSKSLLATATSKHQLATTMPPFWEDTQACPALAGLDIITDCVRCPICCSVYSGGSIRVHMAEHPGAKVRPDSLPKITAQRFSNGRYKKLFEVIPPHTPAATIHPSESLQLAMLLRTKRDKAINDYKPSDIDARAVSPWLLTSGWHLHVARYDVTMLRTLAAHPKGDVVLGKLVPAVAMFFSTSIALIDITNEYPLQLLNSPDPDKNG